MATVQIDRAKAAALGRSAVAILEAGELVLGERHVPLRAAIDAAVAGTIEYPPGADLPSPAPRFAKTSIEVRNETTLAAARRLAAQGHSPAALNFASAKHPGGGFLNGARAQEESIARSSALYACLQGRAMYSFHQQRRDPIYTSYSIYSPRVPVFRDEEGALIEPYPCAFITCAAPNAKVVLERDAERAPEIRAQLAERVARVLAVAAAHDHGALVLGAWGCGVFGNSPSIVAELFASALAGPFDRAFEAVVFAIVDWSAERRFIGPFERTFARAE